ncbi:MAG: VWA domain-containing protein [Sphingomonadaceae bacterium]|nr:VWA domain-containing protein [Sphingomonadaceae bacterium]
MNRFFRPSPIQLGAFLRRLVRDRAGNTMAMIAFAILPVMAMMGGGLDMGRAYLAESRLQQACDAGVLAARKRLGAEAAATGEIPPDAAEMGNRFFNINFRNGSYGTQNRDFVMILEDDFAISGVAKVDVPTTIMHLFGLEQVSLDVSCTAQLNMPNTDIMFVLDTTGSMAETNPGDPLNRIDTMRGVVKNFMGELQANKSDTARLRFGFLPYSTNVNVGRLLKSDWMVDEHKYQSRTGVTPTTTFTWVYSSQYESGTRNAIAEYLSDTCPADTYTSSYGPRVDISATPEKYYHLVTYNGLEYICTASDGKFKVTGWEYIDYVEKHTFWQEDYTWYNYDYEEIKFDVSMVKGLTGDDPVKAGVPLAHNFNDDDTNQEVWFQGCIEERETKRVKNWDNVDLDKVLDLNIDLVPDPTDAKTQWAPIFEGITFARRIDWNGNGSFDKSPEKNTSSVYVNPSWLGDISACPAQAAKLRSWTSDEVDDYLATLFPAGQTYHDLGMIWGGRLLSPTGLFADENADVAGLPTSRHLIFLTDGQTEAYDLAYGAYGIEPLDERRWKPGDALSLTETVEKRFAFACEEVKKKNITVWVIAFGTELNPIMTECAGPGHYFEASDNLELNSAFATISDKLQELRITD